MKLLSSLDNIPVAYKTWLVAVPFVIQLALLISLWSMHVNLVAFQADADRSKALLNSGESAYSSVTLWHNVMLAYAFAPSEENLARMRTAGDEAEGQIENLPRLAGEDAVQLANLRKVRDLFLRLRALSIEFTDHLANGERERALEIVRTHKIGQQIGEIRSQLDTFLRVEQSRSQEYAERLRVTSRRTIEILAVGSLGSFLAIALVGWAVGYSITQRLRKISEHMAEIKAGAHPTSVVRGRDEIGRLDETLHSLSDALREKALEIELFVYSVSHDLRSPLVNLEGFGQELKYGFDEIKASLEKVSPANQHVDRALEALRADMPRSLGFISAAVQRISSIINALLRLSRAGRVEYRAEPVQLTVLAEKVVAASHHLLEERGIVAKVNPLPEVRTDPAAIEQVFGNLVSNAIQYSDMAKEERHIEIFEAKKSARATVIGFRDNGLGIPESAQRKLFLAFQRFHPSSGPGEGIGLAMVRRILSRLGGKIWVESSVGQGACFFVSIPREYREVIEPRVEGSVFAKVDN